MAPTTEPAARAEPIAPVFGVNNGVDYDSLFLTLIDAMRIIEVP
jgi:hypothetical protein